MKPVLVTGAGGFVGRHLCAAVRGRGDALTVVSRRSPPAGARSAGVDLLEPSEQVIAQALVGVETVYYLAAVAHEALARQAPEVLAEVNVTAPVRWLRAAARAGVKRFIWLSSIKVLGDRSAAPLRPDDPYRPGDPYALSKVAAERALHGTPAPGVELAVVRPPLVYGPGVGGNFATLLRWGASALPLPLAGARAPRSLVGVGNLCDLLIRLGEGGSGTFHVADSDDRCVAELLAAVRAGLHRPRRLFALPRPLLRAGARLARREAAYQRLFDPLQVDQTATLAALGWRPPHSGTVELARTLAWFARCR